MQKMRLLKVILAALMAASGFSSCVKDVTGDVPYHDDGSSDVDGVEGSAEEEIMLLGDVPYTEENIEDGEIPEEDEDFVKLDPVSGEEEEEEHILDGDIAYTEDTACKDDSFVLEDEVTDGEEENLIMGKIAPAE